MNGHGKSIGLTRYGPQARGIYTLIRYDIIQGLRNLFDQVMDENIKQVAHNLIEAADDLKYRKKHIL